MKTFRWLCCNRIDAPSIEDYHQQIVVIEGLVTPYTQAETRGQALELLHDWFIENKCRPYREVT